MSIDPKTILTEMKLKELFDKCGRGVPPPSEIICSVPLLRMPIQWLKDGARMATPHMWGMRVCDGAYKR